MLDMDEETFERINTMTEERSKKLLQFPREDQKSFCYLVIVKLAQVHGGFYHFWADDHKKMFMLEGWASGLANLTPYQIMAILSHALQGNHKFSPYPPKTPMEFLDIRRQMNLNRVLSADETKRLLEEQFQGSSNPSQTKESIDLACKNYDEAKQSGDTKLVEVTRGILWQTLGHV